jgi:hypothetical protein
LEQAAVKEGKADHARQALKWREDRVNDPPAYPDHDNPYQESTMAKATNHIDRRAIIKGASAIATAATIASPTVGAAEQPDPIVALYRESKRRLAIADAATKHSTACRLLAGDDVCSGWPPLTQEAAALGVPGTLGESIFRGDIERHNAAQLQLACHHERAQVEADNAARLAWWDRRQAEREHKAEVSGYRAANQACDQAYEAYNDVLWQICDKPATTVAGVVLKLTVVAEIIADENGTEGIEGTDLSELEPTDRALFDALADLRRLLPLAGVSVS